MLCVYIIFGFLNLQISKSDIAVADLINSVYKYMEIKILYRLGSIQLRLEVK